MGSESRIPYITAIMTIVSYGMLIIIGQLRDMVARTTGITRYTFLKPRKVRCAPRARARARPASG